MAYLLPTPGHAALRKGRDSLAGEAYFLTFTTAGRQRLFAGWDAASAMCRFLSGPANWRRASLLAWVLMPDHWHGLLRLEGNDALGEVLRMAKGRSSHDFNLAMQRTGPVWARGCFDHALRRDADLRRTARYLVANPIRAGLVARIGDYPFWDAAWLVDDTPV